MINCPKCGRTLDETKVHFCSNCGTSIVAAQSTYNQSVHTPQTNYNTQANYTYQQNTYTQNTGANYNGQSFQSSNNNNQSQASYGNGNYSTTYNTTPDLPMKWYKFLVCFNLYAGGILNILNGIFTATGLNYEMADVSADLVYGFYGEGLRMADIVFGLACVLLGAYAFVARKKLAEFKKDGVKAYFSYLTIAVSISVIYNAIYMFIIEDRVGNSVYINDAYPAGAIIATSIELLCSRVYFNKRVHLFNN